MGTRLEVCDGGGATDWHEPICYSETSCPACNFIKIIAAKDGEIEQLKKDLGTAPDA